MQSTPATPRCDRRVLQIRLPAEHSIPASFPLSDHRPFDEPVIQKMTTFAWTLIVCAVVSCLARASLGALLTGWQRMSFNLNLTPVFTALIVFFLCMIFRYGAKLQLEADETL